MNLTQNMDKIFSVLDFGDIENKQKKKHTDIALHSAFYFINCTNILRGLQSYTPHTLFACFVIYDTWSLADCQRD